MLARTAATAADAPCCGAHRRRSYPPGGGDGPSCGTLLGGALASQAYEVANLGSVPDGIHLLVLTGCLKASDDPNASAARCGSKWTPANGNLSLGSIPIESSFRTDRTQLPVQAIQLSPAIADLQRKVSLSYGSTD